jgi:hypothetical protein
MDGQMPNERSRKRRFVPHQYFCRDGKAEKEREEMGIGRAEKEQSFE